jgi:hypothetical protein
MKTNVPGPTPSAGAVPGVEGVATFKDVEGFCFIMRVRWVVEARILRRLPDRPMTAGLGSGCFARDTRALATHWQDDAFSLGRARAGLPWVPLVQAFTASSSRTGAVTPSIVLVRCKR